MSIEETTAQNTRPRSIFYGLKLSELFSIGGRLRRSEFGMMYICFLGLFALWLGFSSVSMIMFGPEQGSAASLQRTFGMILGAIGSIFSFVWLVSILFLLIASVKRAHDLRVSGWILLLKFVPIVNIGLFFFLFFIEGTNGRNDYGPDPKLAPEAEPEWVV